MGRFLVFMLIVILSIAGAIIWSYINEGGNAVKAGQNNDGDQPDKQNVVNVPLFQPQTKRNGPLVPTDQPRRPLYDSLTLMDLPLKSVSEQEVASRADGKVEAILVEPGTIVVVGQALAQLDDAVARAIEENLRVKIEESLPAAILAAKLKFDTATELVKQDLKAPGAVAESDKLIHVLQMNSARQDWIKAQVDQKMARSELARAVHEREEHRITSAIAGEVVNVFKKPGENVRSGEPIFRIVNNDKLRAEGAFEVQSSALVKRGMRVLVEADNATGWVKELRGHTDVVNALAVTPDNWFVVSVGQDRSLIVWDWQAGTPISFRREASNAEAKSVACGPITEEVVSQGEKKVTYPVLVGYSDAKARLWKVTVAFRMVNGRPLSYTVEKAEQIDLQNKDAHVTARAILSVAFSPDGQWCATGGADGYICLWDVNDGKFLYRVRGEQNSRTPAHRGEVTTLHFTPDAHLISVGGDLTLKRWKLGKSESEPSQLVNQFDGRTGDVRYLGMTQDGKRALFNHGEELRILDLETGHILGLLHSKRLGDFKNLALFSPSGKVILSSMANGRLRLSRVPATAKEAAFFRDGYAAGFRRNSLSILGSLSALATPTPLAQAQLAPWAATAAKQPSQPPMPKIYAATPSFTWAAQLSFPTWYIDAKDFGGMTFVPELWPIAGYEVRHLMTPDPLAVTCGAFSSDESVLFTAGTDKVIRVWAAPADEELNTPLEALVTFVGNQVESGVGLVRIRAEFDNPTIPSRRLRAGDKVSLTVYPETAADLRNGKTK